MLIVFVRNCGRIGEVAVPLPNDPARWEEVVVTQG